MKKLLLSVALACAFPSVSICEEFWSDVQYINVGVTSIAAYAVVPDGVGVTSIRAYVSPPTLVSILRIYQATNAFQATNLVARTASTSSNIPIASVPTYFAAGDKVILHDVSADKYQRAIVNITNAYAIIVTNDKTACPVSFPLVNGDMIYKLKPVYQELVWDSVSISSSINWQAAHGGCLWYADGRPAMVELISTNGAITNLSLCVSGIRK